MRTILLLLAFASVAEAGAGILSVGSLLVPVPVGYMDATAKYRRADTIVLEADGESFGRKPMIAFEHMAHPGGSKGDAIMCLRLGGVIAERSHAKFKSARMVPTPLGRACQIDILGPNGRSLATELNVMDPATNRARETWLMACNYGDGDKAAEKICRSTLARITLAK